jgi:hypothetical protein
MMLLTFLLKNSNFDMILVEFRYENRELFEGERGRNAYEDVSHESFFSICRWEERSLAMLH